MINNTDGRDVQEQLAKDRRRRRTPGESPYPVEYTRDIADFDNWEYAYFLRLYQGISLHTFETPPRRVLDLGCGSGTWVMGAAAVWPDTTFVGLDMKDIQPDLEWLESLIESEQIARRIKWVHANFLDRWPLAACQFDYVRISRIGLGVPEDEWPDILEEVHRVLKHNGVLDVIEEDLIFPADRVPTSTPPDSETASQTLRTSGGSVSSKASSYPSSQNPSRSSNPGSARVPSARVPSAHAGIAPPGQPSLILPAHAHPPEFRPNPRDHSRLRAAWEALIERRFLAKQPTSVLPLYLSGTFVRLQCSPLLQVPLPPNPTFVRPSDLANDAQSDKLSDTTDDEEARDNPYADVSMFLTVIRQKGISPPQPPPKFYGDVSAADWNWVDNSKAIHLARSVRVIEGCQAAIWCEYRDLFSNEGSSEHAVREGFQMCWENWMNDMADRTGMRGMLLRAGWTEPLDDPDHGPDWRKWRAGLSDLDTPQLRTPAAADGRKNSFTSSASAAASTVTPTALCRSARGFTCFKAAADT